MKNYMMIVILSCLVWGHGKSQPLNENIVINMSGVSFQGKTFTLPVKIKKLTNIFGESDSITEVGDKIIHYWNRLGIAAYSVKSNKEMLNKLVLSPTYFIENEVIVDSKSLSSKTNSKDIESINFVANPNIMEDNYYEFENEKIHLRVTLHDQHLGIKELVIAELGIYSPLVTSYLFKDVPWGSNEESVRSIFRKQKFSGLNKRQYSSLPNLYCPIEFTDDAFNQRFSHDFNFDETQKDLRVIEIHKTFYEEFGIPLDFRNNVLDEMRKELGQEHYSTSFDDKYFRTGWCFENTNIEYVTRIYNGVESHKIFLEKPKYSSDAYKFRAYCSTGNLVAVEKMLVQNNGLLDYKFTLDQENHQGVGGVNLTLYAEKNDYYLTPIMLAAYNGQLDIVKFLYNSGAKINYTERYNVLRLATDRVNLEIAGFLIEKEIENINYYALKRVISDTEQLKKYDSNKKDTMEINTYITKYESLLPVVQNREIKNLINELTLHRSKGDVAIQGKLEIDSKLRSNHPELTIDTVFMVPLTPMVKYWLNNEYHWSFDKSDFNNRLGTQIKNLAYKTQVNEDLYFQFNEIPNGDYLAITFINYLDSIQHTNRELQNVYKKRTPKKSSYSNYITYDEKVISEDEFYEEAGKGLLSSSELRRFDSDKDGTVKLSNGIEYTKRREYVKVPTHKTAEEKCINLNSYVKTTEDNILINVILKEKGISARKPMFNFD